MAVPESIKPGILVCSHGPIFGDRVFCLRRGKRHWVPNIVWFDQYGYRFPEDVHAISDEMLLTYLPGQAAPRTSEFLRTLEISNVQDAREVAACELSGIGVEIGAGGNAFPVPLDCEAQYGDSYSYDELLNHAYPGQPLHDIVAPTIRTDLDTLAGIQENGIDFLVACHVIEHTRNPIGVMANAYQRLRPGGHLTLVIPDRDRTFDHRRAVTTLDHLIEDFEKPDRKRDEEHYRDFFANAEGFTVAPEEFEAHWREQCAKEYSIHFHTWTYSSFSKMVDWTVQGPAPFSKVWSHECLPDGIEFYFTLTK